MFGHLYVSPIIIDFLACYPQLTMRSVFSDRVVDLLEEGLHLAVRIAHLPDSSFAAIKVGTMRRVVCVSPAYLKARGTPRIREDLNDHDAIVFSQDASAGRLQIVLAEYEPPRIPVNVVCREGRRAAAKVRAFVDFAVDRLRARLKERFSAESAYCGDCVSSVHASKNTWPTVMQVMEIALE